MNGGALVIGVKDGTLDITGIQNFGNYNTESAKAKIVEKCKNLPFEGLDIIELKAEDTGAIVCLLYTSYQVFWTKSKRRSTHTWVNKMSGVACTDCRLASDIRIPCRKIFYHIEFF